MAATEGTTMTVQAMGRMLGLKKTESYYLLNKHHFETVTINHQLRIVRDSFEQWYKYQDRYRKVDGPEPGEMLRTQFYSVKEISMMLSICDQSARDLIQKQQWPTMMVAGRLRVPKMIFDKWYDSQNRYRKEEDCEQDRIDKEPYMAVPEMGRLLGLNRRQSWQLYRNAGGQLEMIRVAGRPMITKQSFEKWRANQLMHRFDATTTTVDVEQRAADEPVSKKYLSVRETAERLSISERKVYRLIDEGTFIGKKVGKTWLVRLSDIESYH